MEYHSDRFEDFSLMVFKNEKLVAVLPANRKGNKLFSHQGLSYGGLVFQEKLKFKEVLLVFQSVLKHLNDSKIKEIRIKLLPSIYGVIPNDELQYLAFLLDAKLSRRDALAVVNMNAGIKYSKDRIEGSKRGIKNNLVIKEVEDFVEFWNTILIPNLSNKHNTNPVHSLAEITMLKSKFPKNIRQFNVYKNKEIVAGTTIFETKNVAHSQYISGNENKNSLGSLDFLHTNLLDEIFVNKNYFDFGISNENKGRNVNQGLQYWKEGFGARTIVQDFYTFETNSYTKLNKVML
ncbi:GNAT family N-acetyltransferase [Lacinutrix sp.]|uniref:GNAT family N-acetyltransferase n=1 Tax=Lacinutrix sp. TaxID=1937692 RepID=UPI0026075935|nr:GNAT family N-acetyltransferase [Lacinutrix sp.]MDG1714115.1 GNAT family N-acetyltransferase [Lacinutrix sp.]